MYQAKQFSSIRQLEGISEQTMREHYKLYEGYVKKYNEIMERIASSDYSAANQVYSDIRSLKTDLSFAIGGVKNHEIYFENLTGEGGEPVGKLKAKIEEDFGSYQKWAEDFQATGMSARGWAHLGYDYDFKRLFNYLGDAQNTFPVWNVIPLIALDVYEHAYYLDYQTKRKDYIEAFMKNLNWRQAEKIYDQINRS